MGQQQLLLLVLASVVAIGSLSLGLQIFEERSSHEATESLHREAMDIIVDVQAKARPPEVLGGAGRWDGIDNVTFEDLGRQTPWQGMLQYTDTVSGRCLLLTVNTNPALAWMGCQKEGTGFVVVGYTRGPSADDIKTSTSAVHRAFRATGRTDWRGQER